MDSIVQVIELVRASARENAALKFIPARRRVGVLARALAVALTVFWFAGGVNSFGALPQTGEVRIQQFYVYNGTLTDAMRTEVQTEANAHALYARRVYRQIGINLRTAPIRFISTDATGAPLPQGRGEYDYVGLTKWYLTQPDASSVIPVFYVRRIHNYPVRLGYSWPENEVGTGPSQPATAMVMIDHYNFWDDWLWDLRSRAYRSVDTLAHELGHVLVNDDRFVSSGTGHLTSLSALMCDGGTRDLVYDDSGAYVMNGTRSVIDFDLTATAAHVRSAPFRSQVESMHTRSSFVHPLKNSVLGIEMTSAFVPDPNVPRQGGVYSAEYVINAPDLRFGKPQPVDLEERINSLFIQFVPVFIAEIRTATKPMGTVGGISAWTRLKRKDVMEVCVDFRLPGALPDPPPGFLTSTTESITDPVRLLLKNSLLLETPAEMKFQRVQSGQLVDADPAEYLVSWPFVYVSRRLLNESELLRWTFEVPAPPEENSLFGGDYSGDGIIDAEDLAQIARMLGVASTAYDMTGDGWVDEDDLERLVVEGLHTQLGDANLDGSVNEADLALIAYPFGAAADWAHGDFDGDGVATERDLLLLAMRWSGAPTTWNGYSLPYRPAVPIDSVAEPGRALALEWNAEAGVSYELGFSEDFARWEWPPAALASAAGVMTGYLPLRGPAVDTGFGRVRASGGVAPRLSAKGVMDASVLSWPSVPGRRYGILQMIEPASDEDGAWLPAPGGQISALGDTSTLAFPRTTPDGVRMHYRVVELP